MFWLKANMGVIARRSEGTENMHLKNYPYKGFSVSISEVGRDFIANAVMSSSTPPITAKVEKTLGIDAIKKTIQEKIDERLR